MGIYDNDGKIKLTPAPGSGFCGIYAPDGSWYFTLEPGSGFCGSLAPNGSYYVHNATGESFGGRYAANGALRVTSANEYNGAVRVSGIDPFFSVDFSVTNSIPSLLTFSRPDVSSVATYFDNTGTLRIVATATAPRFNYTYNGSAWVSGGLYLEDATTNYWTNSEDATLWSRTNCSASVTALGAFGGFALATLTQTSSTLATKVDTPAIASVNGNRRSVTVLLYAVGSKTSAWVGLLGSSSTWGLNADSTAYVLMGPASVSQTSGGLWQVTGLSTTLPTIVRVTRTVKTTENISAPVYMQTGLAGTAGDAIKIGIPMFEPGDGSSYVPAGASATSRAAETLQLNGSVLNAATGVNGTMIAQISGLRAASPTTRPAIFYGSTDGLSYQNYSSPDLYSYNGSSALTYSAFDSLKPGPLRVGFAWTASTRTLGVTSTLTSDAAAPWASKPSTIYIGGPTTRSINCMLQSFSIWNRQLTNTEMQNKLVVGASY